MRASDWRALESALFAELSRAASDADRRGRLRAAWDAVRIERALAEVTEIVETTAEEVGDARAA